MTDTTTAPDTTTTPVPAPAVPEYRHWDDIPRPTLLTKTQHAELDMPRVPASRVAARVWGKDFRGKDDVLIDLYDAHASMPTATGPERLLAAAVDRTHTCGVCRAHSERALWRYPEHGNRRLCSGCASVASTLAAQNEAIVERARQVEWAREVTADPTTAWVHFRYARRTRTPAGKLRPPAHVTVTAVDHTGASLARMTIRLAGPRSTDEVPANAVPLDKASRQLARRLADRRLIAWDHDDARVLARWIREAGAACRHSANDELWKRLPAWRGIVTPGGGRVRECLPPGRADRLYVATVRMAAMPDLADDARAWLTTRPGATHVEITGDEEAVDRVHAVLRAVGIVHQDVEPRPVPLPDNPGAVTVSVLCHRDGITG